MTQEIIISEFFLTKMAVDAIGWLGMILILTVYFLDSYGKISGKSFLFHLINFFGAICIMVNTYYYGAWPSVFLNIFWAAIALSAIVKEKFK